MRPQSTPQQLPLFPAEKRCTGCHSLKPVNDFGRMARASDGRQPQCRACRHRYYRAHAEHVKAKVAAWRAVHAEHVKARSHARYVAHKDEVAAQGRAYRAANHERCLEQVRAYKRAHRGKLAAAERLRTASLSASGKMALAAYKRAYHQANRQRYVDAYRAWRHAHPHEARLRRRRAALVRRTRVASGGGSFTVQDIETLVTVQGGHCAYCLVRLGGAYDVDHMTPVTRGGSSAIDNLCIACQGCNRRKFTRCAGEFLALLIKERRTPVRAGQGAGYTTA